MKKISVVLLLLCATVVSESRAGWKKRFRHPKKFVTAVVRTVENKVLEPIAHVVENDVVEPIANGVNDHVFKPAARGFKRKIEELAEQDGETVAEATHEVLLGALTGEGSQEDDESGQQDLSEREKEGQKTAKRSHH